MSTCTSILKSLPWCQGKPSRPGIKRRAFFINKNDIVKWPTLEVDTLGRVTSASYTGSFTLAESAKWLVIDHIADKAEFKSESQGEYPSETFKISASLVHPGIDADAATATAGLLNSDIVAIVEVMNGNFRVIGSQYYVTKTTTSRDNGQGPTGTAGTTINIEASDIVDSPFYSGEIVTEDGTINEAAGV